MPYRWNLVSFDLPDQVDDDTVLMFTDSRETPRFSLTVTEDALGSGASLESYVDGALGELKSEVDGYKLDGRGEKTAGAAKKLKAVEVEHTLTVSGQDTQQVQLYVAAGPGVVVLTATAAPGALKEARAALDTVAGSLKSH